jgi:hypothetical protein
MSFFNYLENSVLDHVVGKTPYTSPTVYIGLSSTTPAEDGTNVTEPSTGSYARVSTAAGDWNAAASGATSNANAVTFVQATADWVAGADLTYLVAYDALTVGNELFYGLLTVAKPVLNGDTASFPAGDIDITLD